MIVPLFHQIRCAHCRSRFSPCLSPHQKLISVLVSHCFIRLDHVYLSAPLAEAWELELNQALLVRMAFKP